ncbi:hypothetical protein HBH98_128830 [Parastagonospora nodorum]|nr:hypothetical protein HBH43_214220 [Parastagonospora nodorum]KAH4344834.1 hypothetical protein HBH98_128830 [Parastagonospora nodorum]KAH4365212.1 hypothetical protein HBH97_174800 [Parastagonospora nodorum]KAH4383745.1 hypothetical protein HBH99_184340 [Parastagonospora nodorum]KAH4900224.1 hypothetical protein HBI80_158340 [Parastagonospora nodorum]
MAANTAQQQLIAALKKIQKDFGLSDAQIQALPKLDDIQIEEQKDSDSITFDDMKNRTAHPFKLFIGRQLKEKDDGDEWRDCFAYLLKNGKSAFQIFLTGLYPEHYWLAGTPDYFGSAKELAFPFNECLGGSRFIALVKFYFLLGHRVGLYPADPGHAVTNTWRKDLQGICDDIIVAEAGIAKENREKDGKQRLEQPNQQALSRTTAQAPPTQLPPPPSSSRRQSLKKPSVTTNTPAVRMEDDGSDEYEQRRDRAMPPPSFSPYEHGSKPRAPGHYQPPPYLQPFGYRQPPPSYGPMPFPPPIGYNPYTGRRYSAHPPIAAEGFGSSERMSSRSSDHMPPPSRPEQPTATPSSRSRNSSASRHSDNSLKSHPVVMLNNLDQAALDAERTGVYLPSSLVAAQLVEEHEQLYQQREQIKARMDAITAQIPVADRQAMVRRLENVQLPTLKRPSGPGM